MSDRWDLWDDFAATECIGKESDVKVTELMLDKADREIQENIRENESFLIRSALKASEFYVLK